MPRRTFRTSQAKTRGERRSEEKGPFMDGNYSKGFPSKGARYPHSTRPICEAPRHKGWDSRRSEPENSPFGLRQFKALILRFAKKRRK